MAVVYITTTPDEQKKVYDFICTLSGEQISVSQMANKIGLAQSRVRYAIEDLISNGYVERVPIKAFNKHYVRYSYKVRKEFVDGSSDTSKTYSSYTERQ